MSSREDYTTGYVFAPLGVDRFVCAGKLQLHRTVGEFSYTEQWLEHPHAYPLDPINLPLAPKVFTATNRTRIHGVFSDSAPDAWGETILLLRHESRPRNELERLVRLSCTGVGALGFSLSRSSVKQPITLPSIDLLERLSIPIEKLAAEQQVTSEELALLEPGSSMGGARPKISVVDRNGASWLIKFSKPSDPINVPLVEFASMSILSSAGLNVPEVGAGQLGNGKNYYRIRRFDQAPNLCHFISAHSLLGVDRLRPFDDGYLDPAGYIAFANILRRVSSHAAGDCRELYRRIIASVLLGNTDDHARNHGMIYDTITESWRLSPLFDVVPILGEVGRQAMTIGREGRDSTISNVISAAPAFGIKDAEAKLIAEEMKHSLLDWQNYFAQCGVSEMNIALLAKVIFSNLS